MKIRPCEDIEGNLTGLGWELELWREKEEITGTKYTRYKTVGVILPNLFTILKDLWPHALSWSHDIKN